MPLEPPVTTAKGRLFTDPMTLLLSGLHRSGAIRVPVLRKTTLTGGEPPGGFFGSSRCTVPHGSIIRWTRSSSSGRDPGDSDGSFVGDHQPGLGWAAMVRGLLILALGACGYAPGIAPDGGHDGPAIDVPPDPVCLGSQAADRVCFSIAPAGTLTLPPTIDTSNPDMCSRLVVTAPAACVIAADQI